MKILFLSNDVVDESKTINQNLFSYLFSNIEKNRYMEEVDKYFPVVKFSKEPLDQPLSIIVGTNLYFFSKKCSNSG